MSRRDQIKLSDAELAELLEGERIAIPVGPRDGGRDALLRRGDWIRVPGLGLCAVRRVHRRGDRVTADVELARDLSERSVELWRTRWSRVDHRREGT